MNTSPSGRENVHVCAVIVNFNSAALAVSAARGLIGQGVSRILIVDNASHPDDLGQIESFISSDPKIKLLALGENVGFGAAVNRGVEYLEPADTEVLIISNPDVAVWPSAIATLTQALGDGAAHMVSPAIVTGQASKYKYWYNGGDLKLHSGRSVMYDKGKPFEQSQNVRPVSFISGAFFAMDGMTWNKLHGFREDFFLYWEDSEFSLRAKRAGVKMACVQSAVCWHQVGGSSGSATGRSKDYFYYMQRNRLLLFQQETGAASLLFGAGLLQTAYLIVAAASNHGQRLGSVLASLRGIVDGLRGRSGRRQKISTILTSET